VILPSKKLSIENSLIYIGGEVLALLHEPKTVSRVWEELKIKRAGHPNLDAPAMTYDWFVLTLDLLFLLGALDLSQGRLYRGSA
jgi:hypothetical protein